MENACLMRIWNVLSEELIFCRNYQRFIDDAGKGLQQGITYIWRTDTDEFSLKSQI